MIVKKGDLFFADLSPVVGSEQGGVRPVLVVQNDVGNKYSPTVIVAAVTSQTGKAKLPTHVQLQATQGGLSRDSVVLLEQLRTIDKQRLKEKIGALSENQLPDVEKAITLAPEEETSYLLRGRIHEAMGNIDAAAADYQNVLELNPFNDEATLLVGQLLITQERLDEAITFFDEAIDLKPDFAKAYAERGRAKNLKGDKEGAFEDLKKSIELNPEGDEARKLEGQHTNFNDMYKGGIF